jgi:hypothetical protein
VDHFQGITPQERYNNDILNELRKLNENMEKLIGRNAQASETKPKQTVRGANRNVNRMAKG